MRKTYYMADFSSAPGLLRRIKMKDGTGGIGKALAQGVGGGMLFGAGYGAMNYGLTKPSDEEINAGALKKNIVPEMLKNAAGGALQGAGIVAIGKMLK